MSCKFELEDTRLTLDIIVARYASKMETIERLEGELKQAKTLNTSYSKTLEQQNGHISDYKKELDHKTKEIIELKKVNPGVIDVNESMSDYETMKKTVKTHEEENTRLNGIIEYKDKEIKAWQDSYNAEGEKLTIANNKNEKQFNTIKALRKELKEKTTTNPSKTIKNLSPESDAIQNKLNKGEKLTESEKLELEFQKSLNQTRNKDL